LQKSISLELTKDAQRLGPRLDWIEIEGDGRNNLDFHIAFYLGRLSSQHRDVEFVVLSKDKGFDALLKHAAAKGWKCRRIESLAELATAARLAAPAGETDFEKALKNLSGIEKKARPRKRKTQESQIASFFQKKLPTAEVQKIVETLFSRNLVSETNNALSYNF
jgi:hypothetical protein